MNEAHKNNNVIAIIDPKQVVLKSGKFSLERHEIYNQKLKLQNKNYELKIYYPIDKKKKSVLLESQFSFMVGIACPYYFKKIFYIFKLISLVKESGSNVRMLVAGDPWLAFLNCALIKLFADKRVLIQTQIHADIGSNAWRNSSFKNRIKFQLAKPALKYSDSIRCVSRVQKRLLISSTKVSQNKMFVSGTVFPLKKIKNYEIAKEYIEDSIAIGYFGRLEEDRGVKDFLMFMKNLKKSDKNFKIVIAGDGSQKEYLLKEINKMLPSERIHYLGYLDSADLDLFFDEIDLCVFTADSESFGRGMRECLANKIQVWSKPTSGFLDLKDICKDEGALVNLDQLKSQSELIIALEKVKTNRIKTDYNELFKQLSERDLESLIGSWLIERNR